MQITIFTKCSHAAASRKGRRPVDHSRLGSLGKRGDGASDPLWPKALEIVQFAHPVPGYQAAVSLRPAPAAIVAPARRVHGPPTTASGRNDLRLRRLGRNDQILPPREVAVSGGVVSSLRAR